MLSTLRRCAAKPARLPAGVRSKAVNQAFAAGSRILSSASSSNSASSSVYNARHISHHSASTSGDSTTRYNNIDNGGSGVVRPGSQCDSYEKIDAFINKFCEQNRGAKEALGRPDKLNGEAPEPLIMQMPLLESSGVMPGKKLADHVNRLRSALASGGRPALLKEFSAMLYEFSSKAPKGFKNFYPQSKAEEKDGEKKGEKGEGDKKKDAGPNSPFEDARHVGLLFGVLAYLSYMFMSAEGPPEITMQEMINDFLTQGYVEKLTVVNKNFCRVHIRKDVSLPAKYGTQSEYVIQLGSPESFEQKIESYQLSLGIHPQDFIPIQYSNERDLGDDLMRILPTLLLLIPFLFLGRSMYSNMPGLGGGSSGGGGGGSGRNIFSLGKAFPAGKTDLKSTTKFKDVAGLAQAKMEVQEFVDFLKDPTKYEHLGAKIPKGGLLVGPPGTGKTLLAKAVAGEADRPFFSMSGSDFIEMFVGVGPSRVRDLFQQAREKAPSIVFIDEIDAVGRKRGKGGFSGGANDERENTLNQLLVEMDGFSSGAGVVVLAGTNRADILDPALTRAGRFDRTIAIDKPDITDRQAIFNVHLKPVKCHPDLNTDEVAQRMAALSPGFAGSEIANICNEAAIQAARRNSKYVDLRDFEGAVERVVGGMTKTNNLMGQREKKIVATHESGHAVVGWFCEHSDPLLKVSIVPRSSGALGFAQYLPEDIALYSQEALLDKIAVALGGRAAEEVFVNSISTGASDDLQKVTRMAYGMVSTFGMSDKVGLVNFQSDDKYAAKPYSDETAKLMDDEAKKIISAQYVRAKELLKSKEAEIIKLTDALFEKETLVYKDLLEILGPRPVAMKKEYEKFVLATSDIDKKQKTLKDHKLVEDDDKKGAEDSSSSKDGEGSKSSDEEALKAAAAAA